MSAGAALFASVLIPLAAPDPEVERPAAFLKGPTVGNKLYVGNLSYSVRDEHLQQQFAEFGNITSAKVMMDRDSGRSKGFGFVEMATADEAQAAIKGLNGMSVDGRSIVVNISRPKEASSGSGYGNGGGGYREQRRSY